MKTNFLAEKAVVACLKISNYTGRVIDKKVTDEVNEERLASKDAGRFNKLILPKYAFRDVLYELRAARDRHNQLTMPWGNHDGSRLLPNMLYTDYCVEFSARKEAYFTAVDHFVKNYPKYKEDAKKKQLGKMFRDEDYATNDEIRNRFGWKQWFEPVSSNDYRGTLSKEQQEDLTTQANQRVVEHFGTAVKDPVKRIIEVVGKMAKKLSEYKPATEDDGAENTFRNTLVTNIQELVPLLEAFNLNGDKQVTELTARIAKELCKHEPDLLREDDKVRKTVAKSAEDILKQAQALMS